MLKAPGRCEGQTGTRILLEAMSKDKVHLARFVLDAMDGEIVDSRTEGAQTPLISSVLLPDAHTSCKFVELLLQRGASVNCQDGDGRTALSHACERGFLDAAKILVRNNADPEIVDCWGNTALMYAAVEGHSHVVEFLVRAFKRLGLQIDRQNKVGNSAVEVAKFLGHTECIDALTNSSKKGNTQPRLSLRCGDEKFERKPLVNKLEVVQTGDRVDFFPVQSDTWLPRPRMKQSRLQSMDSIEEFERENDGSASSPQELDFSGVLTPKPLPRTCHPFPNSNHLKTTSDWSPPPSYSQWVRLKNLFCSHHGPTGTRPNTVRPLRWESYWLQLLPTKLRVNQEQKHRKYSTSVCAGFMTAIMRKDAVCQPVSSAPHPRSAGWCLCVNSEPSGGAKSLSGKTEPPHVIAPPTATSTTTFSMLSNKFLRRFTSPEFKREVKELEGRSECWLQGEFRDQKLSLSASNIPRLAANPASTASAPWSASLTLTSE